MKNKTIFNVITTVMLAGLLILTACPDPGDGGDDGKNGSPSVYSYTFGEIANELDFDIPPEGITLDELCQGMNGMTYQQMLNSGDIPTLYKNEAMTQPFTGSDRLFPYTKIYCDRDLFGHDGGSGGPSMGEKIGEITGTITLTNIPSPAPKLELHVYSEYGFWSSELNKINISGNETTQTVSWSLTIYSTYNIFVPSNGSFYLYVTPKGCKEGYPLQISVTPHIDSANADVGSLGEVSLETITLSGTVNVTCNGQRLSKVRIDANSNAAPWVHASTEIFSPAPDAPWSIIIPKTSNQFFFKVTGYSANGDCLFEQYIDMYTTVNNEDVSGINLTVGDIKIITLSGTTNITYNGQTVPFVQIAAFAYDDGERRNQLGFAYLESPGSNASWSITLQPNLNPPTKIVFNVSGSNNNGQQLFCKELSNPIININNQNVSGITLNVGSITTATLSGTINVTRNNQPVPRIRISVCAYNSENNQPIDWLESIVLESPGANAPWSITLPELNKLTPVCFVVDDEYLFNELIIPSPAVNVFNTSVTGISLNVGDIKMITLSGTINVTCNGQNVSYLTIEIIKNETEYPSSLGYTNLESPGSNASWSINMLALSAPTQVRFIVNGKIEDKDRELWFRKEIPNPIVTVSNLNMANINLDVGNIRFITLSGTFNFTNNGELVNNISIKACDNKDRELNVYPVFYEFPVSGTQWSIILSELNSSTPVKFKVSGSSMNVDLSFYREISGPTLTADNADVSGISLNFGNITPLTLSGTINVNYNGQAVPNVRIEASTYNPWSSSYVELNSPAFGAPWSIKIPSFNSSTQVSFSVVNRNSGENYYITKHDIYTVTVSGSNVSGITLDLGDITPP